MQTLRYPAFMFLVVAVNAAISSPATAGGASAVLGARTEVLFFGSGDTRMYVEKSVPARRAQRGIPVILVHGCCHNGGAYWKKTPDNRPGFEQYFLAAGYTVYVVDLPGHGRSPTPIDFPGLGLDAGVRAIQQLIAEDAGDSVLIGHSMGGQVLHRVIATATPDVRAHIRAGLLLAPVNPPELVTADQPATPETSTIRLPDEVVRQLFAGSPTFPVDAFENYLGYQWPESARHFNEFSVPGLVAAVGADIFTANRIPGLVVAAELDFLPVVQLEAQARYFNIPVRVLGRDWGLEGHGHMFMIEEGSAKIARELMRWLRQNVGPECPAD